MLTSDQADHFGTFGFAVLRGYLADRVGSLRLETGAAIRDAYAATYHERVIDGISGHYLPMASRLTPASASLAERAAAGSNCPSWPGSCSISRPGRKPRSGLTKQVADCLVSRLEAQGVGVVRGRVLRPGRRIRLTTRFEGTLRP